MYLFFLDESGDPQCPHVGSTSFYVLGGLAVPDYFCSDTATHLDTVKRYFRLSQFPEIKWRHTTQPYASNGTPTARTPLCNMTTARKSYLAKSMLEIVHKRSSLIVFASTVDKHRLMNKVLAEKISRLTSTNINTLYTAITSANIHGKATSTKVQQMEQAIYNTGRQFLSQQEAHLLADYIITQFDVYVVDLALNDVIDNFDSFLTKAPALHSRMGIVIQDEQGGEGDNKHLRDIFHQKMSNDPRPLDQRPIHECLMIVPSHHSVGIQLADICMGAIGAMVNRGEQTYYDVIKDNINTTRRKSRVLGIHSIP